jgi:RNA-directed DNA polymerase
VVAAWAGSHAEGAPGDRQGVVDEKGEYLRAVLRGYYQYYGVPLNAASLVTFRWILAGLWRRSLGRRSQTGKVDWQRMTRFIDRWLPPARICHPCPSVRSGVLT